MSDHRHNRCVITEELLSITDDFREAAVLRQMLYWLPRRHDIDDYLQEEQDRRGQDMEIEPSSGWIYKSATELAKETMILSRSTAYRRLQSLEEKGFLQSRENPESDWDNTLQYRLDALAIQSSLEEKGYTLATVMGRDYPSIKKLFEQQTGGETLNVHSETSGVHAEQSSAQSEQTFPETTTETTYRDSGDNARTRVQECTEDSVDAITEAAFGQPLMASLKKEAIASRCREYGQDGWDVLRAVCVVVAEKGWNPTGPLIYKKLESQLEMIDEADEQQPQDDFDAKAKRIWEAAGRGAGVDGF